MQNVTEILGEFVCAQKVGSLPPEVQQEAVRAFVNWAGCCLGGCTHDAVETALAGLIEFSGRPIAPLVGRGERLDPVNAALLNCMSSAVHTFDDTHLKSILHPGGPVISAALALSARHAVSGRELAHALALGIEVSCRIGNMLFAPPARSNLGLFMTGIAGGIGAAVAAGKLLEFDTQRMVHAIGLAVAQASGVREMHATMASSFVCGNAARAGLLAALMAAKGFTSGRRSIEGDKGMAAVFGAPAHLDAVTERLGEHFEMMLVMYKPYPCGVAIHPVIDACLEVAHLVGSSASDIDRVELTVHPVALRLTGRKAPSDGLEAQVSVYHWAAAALLRGKADLEETETQCVLDPRVIALRDRILARDDSSLPPEAARVVVDMKDGRSLTATVKQCRGSPGRPLSQEELTAKFLSQSEARLGKEKAERALRACLDLERHRSLDPLSVLTL